MKRDPRCIFCRIVEGQAPCFKVYEDERVLSFMDLNPASDGHALVITKEHAQSLFEVSEEALTAVGLASRRIAGALRDTLQPDGLRVYQLNGRAAGQSVFHYHMHLVPCASGRLAGPHGSRPGDPERLRELADALVSKLGHGV